MLNLTLVVVLGFLILLAIVFSRSRSYTGAGQNPVEIRTQEPWFSEIAAGRKTVEARPGRRNYPSQIVITCGRRSVNARVTGAVHYDTLDSYLSGEGWQNVAPHTGSYGEARAAYLAIRAGNKAIYTADSPVTAVRIQVE